jgi:hypothetical protein
VEESYVLNVAMETSCDRFARYSIEQVNMLIPLRSAYDNLLEAIGVGCYGTTGQFLTLQEWEDIASDNPRGAQWLSDPSRRAYEVEYVATQTMFANNPIFYSVADCKNSVMTFRIILVKTSIPIPLDLSHIGKCLDYTVCAMDGTFDASLKDTLRVYPNWNFTMFAVEAVKHLMDYHASFQRLYDYWQGRGSVHVINRNDIRIFLLPKKMARLIYSVLALLCDNGELGEAILSRILHEVVWSGIAHTFLLSDILPPPGQCHLLIIPGHDFKRSCLDLGSSDKFSVEVGDTFREYLYHKLGPWHGSNDSLERFSHVYRMPYLGSPRFNYLLDENKVIELVQQVLRSIWHAADADTKPVMLEFNEEWGGYLQID